MSASDDIALIGFAGYFAVLFSYGAGRGTSQFLVFTVTKCVLPPRRNIVAKSCAYPQANVPGKEENRTMPTSCFG
jgi:hypothetical protein